MARIFFAIVIPEEIKDKLELLQGRLVVEPGAVKWVEKQNLHLTLQFIGETPDGQIQKFLDDAASVAETVSRFTIKIRGFGSFPSTFRPRVLWAGVDEGKEKVQQLAAELSKRTGIQTEKPFSPHVTLGRVHQGRTVRISNAMLSERDFYAGAVSVEGFVCMESTLTPKGPVYREIARFSLK